MMYLPTELLNRFQELIYGQCSLRFSPSRLINLETQVRERMRFRGLSSYEDYFLLLQDDVEEFDALIEAITTKETYFFRLPEQFRALGKQVIPEIEQRLSNEARRMTVEEGGPGPWKVPLRIWSAGCATGEEPYSIAMTVMNSLKYPRAWQMELLATDISKKALTTASLGFYETQAIKKIPAPYQKKYLKIVSGGAVVEEELVKKICFRIFNLRALDGCEKRACNFTRLDGTSERIELANRFHVIFCRNVMIYFDFAAQQRLVETLYAALKPGGYLFTGDSEQLHIYKHKFQTRAMEGTYIYQKPEIEGFQERANQDERS